MELRLVEYQDLNARQKEIYNFQKVSAELADFGFNCIKLADDWQGADFLAYHKDGLETLKIQLKPRVYVAEKYCDKELYVAFPIIGIWHLIEHDELLELVGKHTVWLNSDAWKNTRAYSSGSPNRELSAALSKYALARSALERK